MLSTWIQSKKDEEGFTLIELLVVVIIIGILAAIAIPVFLAQRERAWRSASQSDLRNAAVSMETYYTDNGSYAAAGLTGAFGFNPSADVRTATTFDGTNQAYCIAASHVNHDEIWYLGSGGTVADNMGAGCPTASIGTPVPATS